MNLSKKVELLLDKAKISGRSLLTTSCTHALEISAILINIQPGDQVICHRTHLFLRR